MKQAFPMAAISSLAGLFDGSNRVRGQMDAANARKATADADMAEYRSKLRDPSFIKEQALLNLYGGDTGKVKQVLDWQNSANLPTIQGTGESLSGVTQGIGLPSIMTNILESPLTPEGGLKVATGIMPTRVERPDFFSANDEQSMKRQFQNLNLGGLFGMNARQAVENQIDFENQDKNALYQAAAMNMLRQGNIDGANAITSVSNGKTYLPNRMTSSGIVYNQATGGYDEGSATAQAVIANKNQDTAYKDAQTRKSLNDISLSNQDFSIKYGEYLTDANPKLFNKTIVDEQGKISVIEDTNAIKEAAIYAHQNGIGINQARQMILSGKVNTPQNQGNNPFIEPISSSFMPQKSEIKHPADLARAVQSGRMTPEQADQYENKMGW